MNRCQAALTLILASWASVATAQTAPLEGYKPPPDAAWTFDAVVEPTAKVTETALGAGQGVSIRDGKIYAYGDVRNPAPRVGMIVEYSMDLKPTGRRVRLARGDRPVILHPTGLTWDARFGTFLGDTVNKKAVIYRLEWDRAWRDGNLDDAILDVVEDDGAINGCRPEFVTIGGRTLIATADYGDVRPEIRLMDPEAMLKAGRTSAPGVVVHRVLSGPWNQNLHWDGPSGRLVCVENVIEGRGWRLDTIDLTRAVLDGRADGPGVRVGRVTFSPHDELEGYCPIDGTRSLFITSSRSENLVIGTIKPTEPRVSNPPER